jgi:site-specific recombinase XerD
LSSPEKFDHTFQEEITMIASVCSDVLIAHPGQAPPLQVHIDWFANRLAERGYTHATAKEKLRLVTHLSHWLQDRQLPPETLNEHYIDQFLLDRQQQGRAPRHNRVTLQNFLSELREAGRLPLPPMRQESRLDGLERAFGHFLVNERGLSPATQSNYLPMVRRFLQERFGDGPLLLNTLSLRDVTPHLLRHTPTMSPRHAQLLVTALRTFCRFLVYRGDLTTDLATAIPSVADWRLATLPKTIAPEQVTQLLQSCDRGHPTGQRDYAILLLLARLGLRAGEVVALTLDDLDWEAGELLVRGKGGQRDRMPLLQDVGEALVTYIRHVRPRSATRRVFLRMKAPQRGFASSVAVSTIVRRALERAGLEPPCKGAHVLRHSLATDLLRAGASMAQISDVLRHRQPQTTEIYAKVDQAALKTLAQPWPGGER